MLIVGLTSGGNTSPENERMTAWTIHHLSLKMYFTIKNWEFSISCLLSGGVTRLILVAQKGICFFFEGLWRYVHTFTAFSPTKHPKKLSTFSPKRFLLSSKQVDPGLFAVCMGIILASYTT